ncbi:unnamed protein product [Rotaria sp. Silwood1]|nr:unnamed protein product [Rotaria sp. Silwood1]
MADLESDFTTEFKHIVTIDNNGVEYDDESIDDTSSLDEYENEVQSIEHFYQRFNQQYNGCPVFFMGSLQEACQTAFNASTIKDRRPVLVYIHHDKSSYSDTFFSNIFCSDSIIECLLENYIVWPWDITYESNRNILKKIWEEIFSDQFAIIFSYQRCPMLIGIMRRPAGKKGWLISSEYKVESILEWNMLTRTQEKLNRETLKNELIIFKKEFDDNEQNLSFNFIRKTGFCWDIILYIAQYLSVNDSVNFLLGSMNSCDKHRKSCLLPTLIKLITNITNIRHIRLITNKHGLNQLLYEDEWKNLVNSCHNLKTLTFEMTENILQNNQLSEKLLKIQNTIHYFGKTIKFRFICV